jgi:hypothetical protein
MWKFATMQVGVEASLAWTLYQKKKNPNDMGSSSDDRSAFRVMITRYLRVGPSVIENRRACAGAAFLIMLGASAYKMYTLTQPFFPLTGGVGLAVWHGF